jgi:hypothetical protein
MGSADQGSSRVQSSMKDACPVSAQKRSDFGPLRFTALDLTGRSERIYASRELRGHLGYTSLLGARHRAGTLAFQNTFRASVGGLVRRDSKPSDVLSITLHHRHWHA